jgi:hypothetical protein
MRWQPVVCFQGPEQREELGRASRRPRVGVMRVSATRGRRASCEGACVGAAAHSDDDIEQVSSDGVGARCSAAALHSGTACYLEHASPVLPCPALPCPALPGPALPCPALPCPALPCPARATMIQILVWREGQPTAVPQTCHRPLSAPALSALFPPPPPRSLHQRRRRRRQRPAALRWNR